MRKVQTLSETGSAVATRKRAQDKNQKAAAASAVFSPAEARMLLTALAALKQGDSSVRLPVE